MKRDDSIPQDCPDVGACAWVALDDGTILCCESTQSLCEKPELLLGVITPAHDKRLQLATTAINAILQVLADDSDGRKLSFVRTKMGTLLAWVKHGANCQEKGVTYDDSNKKVIKALGLKNKT